MTLTARTAATLARTITAPLCVVLLAGCGGGGTAPADDAARDRADDDVVTLEPDPSATGSSTGSPAPSASASPQGPSILRAAVTAQRALPAATVVSVEDDDEDVRGWEVEVVRPNGETVELVVAPGGGRVTLGPTPVEGDDDVTGLVGQVRVDVAEALRSGVRSAPDGTISAVQLEEEDGVPVWQVDLVDAGGVRIDAVTGESSPDD